MNEFILPEKLRTLTPYVPQSGDFDIWLNANESFISPKQDWFSGLESLAFNRYPDPYATKLVANASAYYGADSKNCAAFNGSDEAISVISSVLLNKGDRILAFTPDFSMYYFYPGLYELELLTLPKSPDFTVGVSDAIGFVKRNNVRAVILSNPCNPTSVGQRGAELLRFSRETGALLIMDEAYLDFWENSESLLPFIGEENIIVLKTASKAVGLASLRLGFAFAGKNLIAKLKAAKSPYNVNALAQHIGANAYADAAELRSRAETIKASAKSLNTALQSGNFPGVKRVFESRTNFSFIEYISAEARDKAAAQLETNKIAARTVGDTFLRITTGNSTDNDAVLRCLKQEKE